jgi:hypothetical protein
VNLIRQSGGNPFEIRLMFARDKTFNFSTCGCFSFPVCSINDQKSIRAA